MALSRSAQTSLIAGAALAAGLAAGAWLLRPAHDEPESGLMLAQPRALSSFALLDQDGATFTPAALQGHWSLLFGGFTHCPDVCPTTLAMLKTVEQDLGPDAARVQVLFLSVDPERDTPAALAQYVHYFSPHFIGLTGTPGEVAAFAGQLGLAYEKVPAAGGGAYSVDHSATLVLLNPAGAVAGYFSPPFKPTVLSSDLRRILKNSA